MKRIGIDYGQRRIGLALTDESGEFIRSLPVVDRKSSARFFEILTDIVAREGAEEAVVGLPLGADDGETAMSGEIRSFAARLQRMIHIPVHFVDESLTSKRANDIIRNRRKKHRRAKENIDRIAACLILEAYQREIR